MVRKGKFNSDRDAYLHELTLMGWANDWAGDVESPTGWFALVINNDDEVESIAQSFPAATALLDELTGFFLVEENEGGFVNVEKFDSADEAREEFDRLSDVYSTWAETGEWDGV
jgi:hypothetical protein